MNFPRSQASATADFPLHSVIKDMSETNTSLLRLTSTTLLCALACGIAQAEATPDASTSAPAAEPSAAASTPAATSGLTYQGPTLSASLPPTTLRLYGLLDYGMTWVNSVASGKGHSNTTFDSGMANGNRLGIAGTSDFGDGIKGVFTLEAGFSLDNGNSTAQNTSGSAVFGRQAWAGIATDYGTLQGGRQYDPIGEVMPAYAVANMLPAGSLAWSLDANTTQSGLLDNRVVGDRVNNMVKYISPTLGGFELRLANGMGEVAGRRTASSSQGASLSYKHGNFSTAAAGFYARNASTTYGNETVADWGANYKLGSWTPFGMITKVAYSQSTKPSATTYEMGTTYAPSAKWLFGVGAHLQTRNNGVKSAHQFTVSASRVFYRKGSASAEIYVVAAAIHDGGWPAYVLASNGYAAAGEEQSTARTGVRIRF